MLTLFSIAGALAIALFFTSVRPLRSMRSRTVAGAFLGAQAPSLVLSMRSMKSTKLCTVVLTRLLGRAYALSVPCGVMAPSPNLP